MDLLTGKANDTVDGSTRLRAALDAAGDAVPVTDAAGRIAECNLATARLNGYDRDSVIGRPLIDVAVESGAEQEELDGVRAAAAGRDVAYNARRRTRRG